MKKLVLIFLCCSNFVFAQDMKKIKGWNGLKVLNGDLDPQAY